MIFFETNRINNKIDIYHQNSTNLSFPLHMHNSFEFIYVYEGEIKLIIDKNPLSVALKKNQAAIILPNQIHAYHTDKYSKIYLCVFNNKLTYDFYETVKDKTALNPTFDFDEESLIDTLQSESVNIYLIKAKLYQLIAQFDMNTKYCKRNTKDTDIVSKILEFIENNYTLDISMRTLADNLNYDYHYLSGLFGKYLNTTFPNLVNEYRTQLAQNMLLTVDKTITEISIACGYESIRSFNRNFKSLIGKTPKEYRSKR